ncbi:hypothetical protein SAMN04489806_1106 [Paramicrobacterium humi]|uniref:Cytotoxic translational repressor of toxin-antitoxin stability system n=1 Tax=Paramicrobacterium humi TaxID=640635 RepID=A0A1H4KC56_9MICO|nr:hypothetical protein [Microbacterium humi]SEB56013.1 hypothetical protein SAMN04489806_1106 [Microbacterium humi]
MSKHPPGTKKDLDAFCEIEGWVLVRTARAQKIRHHKTWELTLWNGDILRTRISRPVNGETYSQALWKHILRDQLQVTEDEFWACVKDSVKPDRGEPEAPRPKKSVPLFLVKQLTGLGVPEDEILELDAKGAAELLAKLLS